MSLYDSLQEQMNNVHIYGDYFMADCPFHDWTSHTQSLMVHEDAFKCLSCGKYGSLEYLARNVKVRGISTKVTRSQSVVLPRWKRWGYEYGDLLGIAYAAQERLSRYQQYRWYFKQRKIDDFIRDGWFGYLDGWCIFPVFNQLGKVVDIVARSTKSKQYVVSPANIHPLYVPSWQNVLDNETVYVVYGTIDVWRLYELGLPGVTGVTGQSLSAALLKPLDKRYVIIPDRYEERSAYKLAGEIGWKASVLRFPYPDDTKDIDDVRVKYGVDFLKSEINRMSEWIV